MYQDYVYPEEWKLLERIARGSKVIVSETPHMARMGMTRSFTVGKGRVNWNADILDKFNRLGYLDRFDNTVTPFGNLALISRS